MFPPMVVQMINVGEQTGGLDNMLTKIADFYDDRASTTLCGLAYGKPLFSLSPLNPPFDVLNGGPVGVRNQVGVGFLDDFGRVA